MNWKEFLKAGHWPTLLASFLYFDVSFMVWVILGPLGPFLGESLHLSATQKGFLVSVPLLAGSFFRPLMGALADRIGGKITGLIGLTFTLTPLLLGWMWATELQHFYLVGILLGVAGASFAVALPLASRWYPPEYQGTALGIAGAGNSGTVLATLFIPRLAAALGWKAAFGIAALPVLAVLVVFAVIAKESPAPRRPIGLSGYKALLAEADTRWFCVLYSITFGGFVGLATFLTLFFVDQYHLSKVGAGDIATLIVICGSGVRPVGGWLADRFGGYRVLLSVLVGVGLFTVGISTLPPLQLAVALFMLTMALLGIGNGAIFQLVPQRFPMSVGIVTGLVGAAGGIGGFCLPSLLGMLKDKTGSYSMGFLCFAAIGLMGFLQLLRLGSFWSREWSREAGERTGVFCYREWFKGLTAE